MPRAVTLADETSGILYILFQLQLLFIYFTSTKLKWGRRRMGKMNHFSATGSSTKTMDLMASNMVSNQKATSWLNTKLPLFWNILVIREGITIIPFVRRAKGLSLAIRSYYWSEGLATDTYSIIIEMPLCPQAIKWNWNTKSTCCEHQVSHLPKSTCLVL